MNRLAICLRHAAALGLDVDLQATDKARALLGRQRHTVQNIPAMAWQDVPAFYQSLNGGTLSELALKLTILTAMRSKAVRHMHEDQLDGNVWTVPAEYMKGRKGATKDFRVALSGEALAVIDEARKFTRDGSLFPGVRKGVISDMTMTALLNRRGIKARVHGFRSSLRVWLAEAVNAPHDVAETCLGHVVGGAVERAYRRTDFLEQRRALMERWAGHVSLKRSYNVVADMTVPLASLSDDPTLEESILDEALEFCVQNSKKFVTSSGVYLPALDEDASFAASLFEPIWQRIGNTRKPLQFVGHKISDVKCDVWTKAYTSGYRASEIIRKNFAYNDMLDRPFPKSARMFRSMILTGDVEAPPKPKGRPSVAHRDTLLVALAKRVRKDFGLNFSAGRDKFLGSNIPVCGVTLSAAGLYGLGIEIKPETARKIGEKNPEGV